VTGKASDIVGVCIDPVTAQEMITLVRFATVIQFFRLPQRLPWSGAHGMLNSGESSARWSNCSGLARIDYLTVSVGHSGYEKLVYQAVRGLL
jgi:hypothetical protein